MNTSLTRIMLVSISLCWLLSAKVHLDDQIDPSVAEKIAIEALLQQSQEVEVQDATDAPAEEVKTMKEILSLDLNSAKEAHAREIEANKVEKTMATPLVDPNAKETATSLEYNLQPVSNKAGTVVNNPQVGEKAHLNTNPEKN